jgi:anthranilate phosphoribosyltransferase
MPLIDPVPTWPDLLTALLRGEDLNADQAAWVMAEVMAGDATPAQVAGFVVALRAKGETAAEVGGMAQTMLAFAAPLQLDEAVRARAVDTCGTGGDRSHTVNISTMAAFVVAGTGTTVVKHGNRAASSSCGSADLLAELGVAVELPPAGVEACLEAAGAAFCFAPVFHPAMRHAGVVRKELGVPTVFNILGPLTNPARPGAQSLGVADARLAPVMAQVLATRGTRALLFRGDDGLDELTPVTTSTVWVVADGQVRQTRFDPRDVGIGPVDPAALRGGDAVFNAGVARAVLGGQQGPVRDAVLLAAAATLLAAAGPASDDLAAQLRVTLDQAAESLDSGAAEAALDRWVEASQKAAATI